MERLLQVYGYHQKNNVMATQKSNRDKMVNQKDNLHKTQKAGTGQRNKHAQRDGLQDPKGTNTRTEQ
ncbi:hypothetical protein BH09BAC1_BH09BAC1_00580 [soil metagenome]